MIRIEDLLHSLTTVIVRYHDTQRINVLVAESDADTLMHKSRMQAIKILHHETEPYDKRLNELITECTKGYRERSPFLFFILNEIIFLKSMLSREASFTEDELSRYKQQLLQMFIDFGQLLITKKDVTYRVTCSSMSYDKESPKHISLTGLINTAYLGSTLCNSGILLGKEVLERLHISSSSRRDEIEALVENLCTEHQNALLVPELLKKQVTLQNKVDELTSQIHKLHTKQLQTEEHALTIQSQAQKLEHTETLLRERTSSVVEIMDKLKRSEASHHTLQLKMTETEQCLTESTYTISDLKEQVSRSKYLITELSSKITKNEETISELNKKLTDGEKIKSTFVYNTLLQKPGAFTRILQAQNSELTRSNDALPPHSGLC